METKNLTLKMLEMMDAELKRATDGLTHDEIKWRPNSEANPIGFILWHMLTGEDLFVHGVFQQKPPLWSSEKWYRKMGVPEEPLPEGGYGATPEQIAAFPVPELKHLLDYAEAVRSKTVEYVQSLKGKELDAVPEGSFFGEMTRGEIIAMLICEVNQHLGHIAYIRGLQRGINK